MFYCMGIYIYSFFLLSSKYTVWHLISQFYTHMVSFKIDFLKYYFNYVEEQSCWNL